MTILKEMVQTLLDAVYSTKVACAQWHYQCCKNKMYIVNTSVNQVMGHPRCILISCLCNVFVLVNFK